MITVGNKVKFRSSSLNITRIFDCDVGTGSGEKIFDGTIGEIIEIRQNGHWSPLDILIQFSFGAFWMPANFFWIVRDVKKGHHLTDMFKREEETPLKLESDSIEKSPEVSTPTLRVSTPTLSRGWNLYTKFRGS